MQQGQPALSCVVKRVHDPSEGQAQTLSLAFGIAQDVQALGPVHRQAPHHHGQNKTQAQLSAVVLGESAQLGRRQVGVGAAQRAVKIDHGARWAGVLNRLKHWRPRRHQWQQGCVGPGQTGLTQASLQVMQSVQAPVPLTLKIEGGAKVVPPLMPQGGAAFEHLVCQQACVRWVLAFAGPAEVCTTPKGVTDGCQFRCPPRLLEHLSQRRLGRFDLVVLGLAQKIRHVQPQAAGQALGIQCRPILQFQGLGGGRGIGGRHQVWHQTHPVFRLEGLEMQGSEVAVRVVDLVKIMHCRRLPAQPPPQRVALAAELAQGRAGQGLADRCFDGRAQGRHVVPG